MAAGSIQITAKIKPYLNCSSLISVASLALLISQCNNKHLMTGAEETVIAFPENLNIEIRGKQN